MSFERPLRVRAILALLLLLPLFAGTAWAAPSCEEPSPEAHEHSHPAGQTEDTGTDAAPSGCPSMPAGVGSCPVATALPAGEPPRGPGWTESRADLPLLLPISGSLHVSRLLRPPRS